MSSEIEQIVNVDDLFAEVSTFADELYSIRDTYFPINPDDKTSKLLAKSNLAIQLLDKIPPGTVVILIRSELFLCMNVFPTD